MSLQRFFEDEEYKKLVIDESIKNLMKHKRMLNEYATTRDKFINLVNGLTKQIIENIAVVGYFFVERGDHPLIHHWLNELKAHANNIIDNKIKNNNNYKIRYKAIYSVFDDNSVFTNTANLYIKKLDVEKLEYDKNTLNNLTKYVIEKVEELMNIMANSDSEGLVLYLGNMEEEIESNATWRMGEYDIEH